MEAFNLKCWIQLWWFVPMVIKVVYLILSTAKLRKLRRERERKSNDIQVLAHYTYGDDAWKAVVAMWKFSEAILLGTMTHKNHCVWIFMISHCDHMLLLDVGINMIFLPQRIVTVHRCWFLTLFNRKIAYFRSTVNSDKINLFAFPAKFLKFITFRWVLFFFLLQSWNSFSTDML